MSAILSHTNVEQMIKEANFPLLVKAKMKENQKALRTLSLQIGRSESYLGYELKKTDQRTSILVLLSRHLDTNLFEPFLNLLPENIRITQKEKELLAQIESLQKQVDAIARERDIYKEVVMHRSNKT